VAQGPGYFYRPGQVLVADGQPATAAVVRRLRQAGAAWHEQLTASAARAGLPVLVFQAPGDTDIPGLVDTLRQEAAGQLSPGVSPNHVLAGQWDYQGGAVGPPLPAARGSEYPDPRNPAPGGPQIAILDTGYDPAVAHLHPGLAERLVYTAADAESALSPGGYLAAEAGHGTFIAGIVMGLAPRARIRPVKVLSPAGVGDDLTVALGLARASAPVVNLSLGGYTQGGVAPVALAAALARLDSSVAVVAAAGNNGSDAPFWPAAFPRVVAVGAVDTTTGTVARAGFSDFGSWVDVYAPGVDVRSSYLDGSYLEPGHGVEHLDGWARWSGTSFAAPQVAGEIARLVQAGTTARQAASQVLASARWVRGVGPVLLP
jgi:subtilisin family serine protease